MNEGSQRRTVAIVQARMGSTRLPGKVLADLCGEPMLGRQLNRLSRAESLDLIVIATTIKREDDAIVDFCKRRAIAFYRGSENDVLDRYYQAALHFSANIIVRITADCPLIEPAVVDELVTRFINGQPHIDYASTSLPIRTFPRGLDAEVMRFDVLEKAWREDDNPAWREHVTPYIYLHPDLFWSDGLTNEIDHSAIRWTVDEIADLQLVRKVYEHFGHDNFSWIQVLSLYDLNPCLKQLNAHVQQKEL